MAYTDPMYGSQFNGMNGGGISEEDYAKAFKRQQFGGQVGAVAGGIGSLWGQAHGMIQQGKYAINPNAAPEQMDAYGNPMYNLGGLNQQLGIKAKGASAGDIGSGALSGLSAGAAFGPIGMGIGALVGGVSSALAGQRKKKLMQKSHRLAMQNFTAAQSLYSKDKLQANNQQLGMGDYNQLMNNQDRLNNLYSVESGQQS